MSNKLSPEGVANVIACLEVIRKVVARLLSEGYTIKDGEVVPPPRDEQPPSGFAE